MPSNRTSLYPLALGALALGALMFASPAQAQSCDPDTAVHSSYPADGAMGVPTNTAIFVYGPDLEVDSHVVALEDGSGAAVEDLDVRATEGGLLIEPIFGLTPSSRYELTLTPDGGGEAWSATFNTGTGPATPVQLEAPAVAVSIINRNSGSCGNVPAICVTRTAAADEAFSIPARMSLEILVGDEVLSVPGGQPVPAFTAGGGSIAADACVEVRIREPGGFVSEETRVCGNAISRVDLAASAAAPTSCLAYAPAPARNDEDDEEDDDGEESGGCALGSTGAASGGAGLVLLLGTLLGLRRRPR